MVGNEIILDFINKDVPKYHYEGKIMKQKQLTFFDLITMGVGLIIGSGIFILLGFGIEYTGRSVNIAILLATIFIIFMVIPFIFIVGVADLKGGSYSHAKILLGDTLGALSGYGMFFAHIALAIYCISIIDYLIPLIPFLEKYPKIFSLGVLVLFFAISYTGLKNMALFQGIIVVLLIVALLSFTFFGIPKIQPGYFREPGFLINGVGKLLLSSALLTFALMGGHLLLNFYNNAKNPGITIPWAIILSTVFVGLIYFGVAMVAAGVLPHEEVSGKTLTAVANAILPKGLYIFFLLGGAILAMGSTLNGMLAYMPTPLLEIARDGYLPKVLLKTNKNDYPYVLMAILFILALIPIVSGLDADIIVSFILAPNYILFASVCFRTIKILDFFPEKWAQSPFRVPKPVVLILSIISGLIYLLQGILLFSNLSSPLKIGNLIVAPILIAIAFMRTRQLRNN